MICISDLQQLIAQWIDRLGNNLQPFDYRNGINECINDLNLLIEKSVNEELDYQDMLDRQTKEYFSNLESEDCAAA